MVGGQVLDIQSEQRVCTADDVIAIQTRKTGALLKAACMLGVLAAGGTQQMLGAAAAFADHLGLAFQIRDDMLDVIGTTEDLGKAVGTDATKNTFVRIYGLSACEELVIKHTELAVAQLEIFPDNSFMKELAYKLTNRLF